MRPAAAAAPAPSRSRSALPDTDIAPSWDTGAAGPEDRGAAAEPAAAAAYDDEVEVEADGGLDPRDIEACAKAATEVARQYGQAAVLRGKGPIRILANLGVNFQALNYSQEVGRCGGIGACLVLVRCCTARCAVGCRDAQSKKQGKVYKGMKARPVTSDRG